MSVAREAGGALGAGEMRRIRTVLPVVGLWAFAAAQAGAQPPLDDQSGFPKFDIANACRAAAQASACIASEQDAADILRQRWPSLSAEDRTRCVAVGRATGGGSYLATLGCLSKPADRKL